MKKVLRGVVAAATACTVMLGGVGAAFADSTSPNGATAPVASDTSSGAGAAGAADPGAGDAGAPADAAAADTSTADYAAGKINEALGATPADQADAWMVSALQNQASHYSKAYVDQRFVAAAQAYVNAYSNGVSDLDKSIVEVTKTAKTVAEMDRRVNEEFQKSAAGNKSEVVQKIRSCIDLAKQRKSKEFNQCLNGIIVLQNLEAYEKMIIAGDAVLNGDVSYIDADTLAQLKKDVAYLREATAYRPEAEKLTGKTWWKDIDPATITPLGDADYARLEQLRWIISGEKEFNGVKTTYGQSSDRVRDLVRKAGSLKAKADTAALIAGLQNPVVRNAAQQLFDAVPDNYAADTFSHVLPLLDAWATKLSEAKAAIEAEQAAQLKALAALDCAPQAARTQAEADIKAATAAALEKLKPVVDEGVLTEITAEHAATARGAVHNVASLKECAPTDPAPAQPAEPTQPAQPTAPAQPAQPAAPAPADPAPAGSAKPATPAKPGKTVVKKSAKKLPNTGVEAASLALLSGALLAGGALAVRRRRAA
ncbi:LPXTG cell wall anchor domain-containing protein [Actinotignum schaalii]|uniref:LPXTG cell wall anchor domain-containing protein n=1 Tax=Actinotignum schaalii TaxID=59505 RepID=UPI0004095F38|nr:LPXTG cell wall anchor domain-containing protein [Actinotignum schaalii]AIE82663.1 hypothetical protein FB03_04560 [Actinotignum schaalii]WQN44746.1 LPXTG cell wall anchor domain-containing protein [Actinotignum schaalii]